jgi:CheY-like chemotaxis protein
MLTPAKAANANVLVLVVEDDTETLASISDLLRAEDYSVIEACNGQEALERLREPPLPSVIMLDLLMPVMDGREFLERRKQVPELARIPVVVMTAAGSTDKIDAALVLRKPVEPKHLLRAVAECCRSAVSSNP